MAILKTSTESREVPDGEPIMEACEELGVPYGCKDGLCQSCRIEIIEGMENLSDPTQAEKDAGIPGNERLACQCKIIKGSVNITSEFI